MKGLLRQQLAEQLRKEAKQIAAEMGCDLIQAYQAIQGAAAQKGDEQVIQILHEIKMEEYEQQQKA